MIESLGIQQRASFANSNCNSIEVRMQMKERTVCFHDRGAATQLGLDHINVHWSINVVCECDATQSSAPSKEILRKSGSRLRAVGTKCNLQVCRYFTPIADTHKSAGNSRGLLCDSKFHVRVRVWQESV